MNRAAAIAAILLLLMGTGAQADTRSDVLSGIARCGGITDNHIWLNCLYGAAQPMRSELGLPPAPASQTSLVPAASAASPHFSAAASPAAAEPKENSGILSYVFGGDALVTKMPLSDYEFNSQGLFTVTLANGQVWEQRDGPLAHWRGPAAQYIATISKGAVGSFNLIIAHESAQYKVLRIR